MADKLLEDRVTNLERTAESLAEVPVRMTRLEDRFGGLEGRFGVLERRVTGVEVQILQLRTEMHDGFSAVLEVVESGSKATRQLIEETRTDMRVLHEELVSRIKTLGKN